MPYKQKTKITTLSKTDNKSEDVVCDNCHAKVIGSFCSQCGQSVESTLKYFWSVILHLLDDIFSFDSRASRTLKPLLFTPGFLTNEYIQGRRVHYVPPLRLYLFISIIFFLSLKFFAVNENSGFINIKKNDALNDVNQQIALIQQRKDASKSKNNATLTSELKRFEQYKQNLTQEKSTIIKAITVEIIELELIKIDNEETLTERQQKKYQRLDTQLQKAKNGEPIKFLENAFSISNNEDGSFTLDFLSKENNEKLSAYVKDLETKARTALQSDTTPLLKQAIGKLPQLMFILLPIFALLLKIMYFFSKRLYLEHLTVALHSHSFIFLVILLMEILDYLQSLSNSSGLPSLSSAFNAVSVALLIWLPVYLFIMQKRVYRKSYLLTLLKFGFIGITYIMLISFTSLVAFVWGLAEI
jgi:hypothetical protein